MTVEITLNTPLADALAAVIQPKLVDVGWSTGGVDDSALSEYIILMLVNGKTQDQIAAELSGDLLNLGPDDPGAIDFSRWLFEQLDQLDKQFNGGQIPSGVAVADAAEAGNQAQPNHQSPDHAAVSQDAEMEDVREGRTQGQIPTGPKSMRNDSRNKRLFGQMTKALDRSGEAGIHRVRAHQGTERINGHSRDPPKGPRMNANRGPRLVTNRPMGGGMPSNGMGPSGPAAALMGMSPQQQMQLFAMYEEQARMMSQILSPQQQQQMFVGPGFNPAMGGMGGPGMMGPGPGLGPGPSPQSAASGRSLFDRIEHPPPHHHLQQQQYQQQQQQHRNGAPGRRPSGNMPVPHSTGPSPNQPMNGGPPNNEPSSSMEVVPSQEPADVNPATTICRFNLTCTKEDCAFAHQSPAAPAGTTIDVTDECSFGAACKNRKCVARHPSPAKKSHHQSEQDCKFFPHCTNPACPFRHPTMPLCRNGADCTRPGCRFTHVKSACKYNPCLNPACQYKHVDGQKRGAFDDKVWVAEGGNEKPHVSERKFVDEMGGEEELIIPTSSPPPTMKVEATV